MTIVTRRALLALATAALLGASHPAAAQPAGIAPGTRFSSVAVDVRPLYAKGLGAYAEFLARNLTAEL